MGELVRYNMTDGVAVITIDNPPVNALSPPVWEGLDEAVARANGDARADAIVLIGAGSTFIAGADIKIFDTLKTREDSLARSAGTHALLTRVEDSARPLVAAPRRGSSSSSGTHTAGVAAGAAGSARSAQAKCGSRPGEVSAARMYPRSFLTTSRA